MTRMGAEELAACRAPEDWLELLGVTYDPRLVAERRADLLAAFAAELGAADRSGGPGVGADAEGWSETGGTEADEGLILRHRHALVRAYTTLEEGNPGQPGHRWGDGAIRRFVPVAEVRLRGQGAPPAVGPTAGSTAGPASVSPGRSR